MKKKIIMLVLGSILLSNSTVFATTNTNVSNNILKSYGIERTIDKEESNVLNEYSYKIEEILKNDEKFKQDLKNGAKIVGVNDMYIKYTLKESSRNVSRENRTAADYETKTYTYQEYLEETAKENQKATIGGFVQPECSWLNLFMSVVDYGDNLFSASSYFNWRTFPAFTFTDGHGISVDPTFTILTSAPGNYSNYEAESIKGRTYVNTTKTMKFNRRGSVSDVPLQAWVSGAMTNKHYGKHQIVFESNNVGNRSGNVYNNYLHKEIALGSIGVSADGTPNLSVGGSTSTHSGAITIRNLR